VLYRAFVRRLFYVPSSGNLVTVYATSAIYHLKWHFLPAGRHAGRAQHRADGFFSLGLPASRRPFFLLYHRVLCVVGILLRHTPERRESSELRNRRVT